MANPLLVFRVGYMESYDSAGEITGGGSYVDKNGNGGEMWNFRSEGGRCYGYVMTLHFAGVDLRRITPGENWKKNDELAGVDIVFIARRPGVGQVVIGWYRNATVFHKAYRKRRGRKKVGDWDGLDYLCEVDAEHAVLLPEDQRKFPVPSGEKGRPGQSNVWYPPIDDPHAARFVATLRKLIGSRERGVKPTNHKLGGRRGSPDEDLITKIEQAAVAATKIHFKKQGYEVKSFEQDNRGWDLEARKGDERLLIEVKGHIGNVIQFELTPNEYSKLQKNSPSYRVCVLRNALKGDTDLEIYTPKRVGGEWRLKRLDKPGEIRFLEKIAARAFES